MRMTNRLSKWSRRSSQVVCLLAACGLMYACKDEFTLDDESPVGSTPASTRVCRIAVISKRTCGFCLTRTSIPPMHVLFRRC